MSLSGSAAEDYSKTGDAELRVNESQGPEPTRENPAGVFPQATGGTATPGSMPGAGPPDNSGDARHAFGNPEVFRSTFANLSHAIDQAINTIDDEAGSGLGSTAKALKKRLLDIREEVDGWRAGKGPAVEEKDEDVSRPGGEAGGLYKD